MFSVVNYASLYLFPVLAADAGNGGGDPGGQGGGGMLSPIFMILMMFVIFYFLIIRPQRKAQRQKQQMISELQKHDEVITRGGIIGTVIEVRDDKDEVVVEIDKGTRIRIRRPAIEGVFPRDGSDSKEEGAESR